MQLLQKLKDVPSEWPEYYEQNFQSPQILWDDTCRVELCQILSSQAEELMGSRMAVAPDPHVWGQIAFQGVNFTLHKDHLCVGDVFVSLYLRNPEFPLSNPTAFIEALMQYFMKHFELKLVCFLCALSSLSYSVFLYGVTTLSFLAAIRASSLFDCLCYVSGLSSFLFHH
jgi:hypothetical protein